jgi:hypothetical protein
LDEMQVELRQDFLDFVERLAPEERRAQHLGFRLLDQFADGQLDDRTESSSCSTKRSIQSSMLPYRSLRSCFSWPRMLMVGPLQHAAGQRPGDVDVSTVWLGREDSNLRMVESKSDGYRLIFQSPF